MVNRQTVAVFLAIWVLVAMPGFCTAGILEHVCECDGEPCCDEEAACCSDPCDIIVASPDRPGHDDNVPLRAMGVVFLSADAGDFTVGSRVCVSPIPPPNDLPYAPSDRPLLI